MDDEKQHWTQHIKELRLRVIWVTVTFFLALIVGFIFAHDVIQWMKQEPLAENVEMHNFSPGEPLRIYMQFAMLIAVVITLPVAFYQAWAFIRPGLTPKERRSTLMYIPLAIVLLICGLLFGYYIIFPFILNFMSVLTQSLGATETYGMFQYFSFMFRIVVPITFLFELPVVVLFLTRIGILKPDLLRKGRRYAYLGLVILAAVLTPPDLVSNILVAIPLIVLYEISILLSDWTTRRMNKQKQMEEAEVESD